VEEVLGSPTRSIDIVPLQRKIIRIHLYPKKDTKLITHGLQGSAALPALDTVICIIANGRSAGPTPENIQIGDAKERLIATYGEPKKITEMGGFLYYLYPEKGALFSLRHESVISWILWFDLE